MRVFLLHRDVFPCNRATARFAVLLSCVLLSSGAVATGQSGEDEQPNPLRAGSASTYEPGRVTVGGEPPSIGPLLVAASLPRAKSIDLEMPIEEEDLLPADSPEPGDTDGEDGTVGEALVHDNSAPPLVMLGTEVPPVTSTRLSWSPDHSFEGLASPTPVLVVNGAKPGPTLCLTAAIHGDELNGIEIVRRVLHDLEPESLSGAVIGVPIVNLQGFQRRSRYLTDRRDLNRHFPGSPTGSSAARIAHSFFHEVIKHCSTLVDIHTGSFDRTNLLQLRADLSDPRVVELTRGFGATVVLHNEGAQGTLRRASAESGIPAITLEVGAPMRLQQNAVKESVETVQNLLDHLAMVKRARIWGTPEPVYYRSQWLRANVGGILLSQVKLGETVSNGDTLGFITNPITNIRTEVKAPFDGRVLGMALDQVVMPGYAAYHIGTSAEAEEISGGAPEDAESPPQDESDDDASLDVDNGDEAGPPVTIGDATDAQSMDESLEFD